MPPDMPRPQEAAQMEELSRITLGISAPWCLPETLNTECLNPEPPCCADGGAVTHHAGHLPVQQGHGEGRGRPAPGRRLLLAPGGWQWRDGAVTAGAAG